jgi:hypothetical protein
MEKKTKIILGVAALAFVAYLTRDKWMVKKENSKKDKSSSEFSGFDIKKKKKSANRTVPTDSSGNCPSGTIKYGNSKDGYYCKNIQGKDLSSMA